MKILFIGDIFGKPGREIVKKILPGLKKEYAPDFVIANAENMSHGSGISPKNISEMKEAGIDFFTAGNHIWREKSIISSLDDKDMPVVRPANYPRKVPGRGFEIVKTRNGGKVLVINLLGQVFIKDNLNCPFEAVDRILEEIKKKKVNAIVVDFHAEATSEKWALGHYLDGRVSAVFGTHTHVATMDARIMSRGTAFQTDVGFCGCLDSVIGAEKNAVIEHFVSKRPLNMDPASGGATVFGAVFVDVDDKTGLAVDIESLYRVID